MYYKKKPLKLIWFYIPSYRIMWIKYFCSDSNGITDVNCFILPFFLPLNPTLLSITNVSPDLIAVIVAGVLTMLSSDNNGSNLQYCNTHSP